MDYSMASDSRLRDLAQAGDAHAGAVLASRIRELGPSKPAKRGAAEAYMEHHQASLALLARITETIANHDGAPAEDLHWGHVGDIASVRGALQAISDQIHHEGEHAE